MSELVYLLSFLKVLLSTKLIQEIGNVGNVVIDLVLLIIGNSFLLKTRDEDKLFFIGCRYGWNFSETGSLTACFISANWI